MWILRSCPYSTRQSTSAEVFNKQIANGVVGTCPRTRAPRHMQTTILTTLRISEHSRETNDITLIKYRINYATFVVLVELPNFPFASGAEWERLWFPRLHSFTICVCASQKISWSNSRNIGNFHRKKQKQKTLVALLLPFSSAFKIYFSAWYTPLAIYAKYVGQ